MQDVINSLDRVIYDLKILKIDLENLFEEDDFEMKEKVNMILSMREQNLSIDDIATLSGLSIRDVVDILGL